MDTRRIRKPSPDCTRILALGTAVPHFCGTQADASRFFRRVLLEASPSRVRDRALELNDSLVEAAGIATRHSVIDDYGRDDPAEFTFYPPRWDLEPFPSTARRMEVYERESVGLAATAGLAALERSGVAPSDVTHLVVCTCTGFFAPGPDVLLLRRLGLRSNVSRTMIGFMGCHGGFNGLRTADEIVRADPEAVVLQICVELCSLHFQKRPRPDLVVANLLFADGASAAVFGSASRFGRGVADVAGTASRVSEDSLDQMTWRIGDTGFEMSLDLAIPKTLSAEAPSFLVDLLAAGRTAPSDVRHWAFHPGGRRIVEAVAEGLRLEPSAAEASLSVLRDFGNMSSGTVFFILERIANGGLNGAMVAMGFGPGLTTEGAVLVPCEHP